MESPSFVVRLSELERGPKKVTFTLTEGWLTQALADANAVPQGAGEAAVELIKTGATVVVRGKARVNVTVPCVVTLSPLPFELEPEIFLQLAPEPETKERPKSPEKKAQAHGEGHDKVDAGERDKAGSKDKGRPRSRRRLKEDPELTAEEAAYDTFKGDEIVLDGFIREFIVLELPAYPRRSDLPSPEESLSSRPLEGSLTEGKPIDPRLLPLLGLANRLRGGENKE